MALRVQCECGNRFVVLDVAAGRRPSTDLADQERLCSNRGMLEVTLAILGFLLLAAIIAGLFWLVDRLLKKAQAEDRSYGGSGDSGAGVTGVGDPGPP
jgi:hypothetical protein